MELTISECNVVIILMVLLVGLIESLTSVDTAVGFNASHRQQFLGHSSAFLVVFFAVIIDTIKPLWIGFPFKIAAIIIINGVEFLALISPWPFNVLATFIKVKALHLFDIFLDFLFILALAGLTFFVAFFSN